MTTTIFTAGEYDPAKERRKRKRILAIVCAVLIVGGLGYLFRNWRYEYRVNQFFTLLQQGNYPQAYGLWTADPNWQQHPQRHQLYPFTEFYQDWGPGGDWGLIHSHRIVGSAAKGSGVIVAVRLNDRVDPVRLWVEKKDQSLTWSPY
jgi:hypothetical protein